MWHTQVNELLVSLSLANVIKMAHQCALGLHTEP